MIGVTPGSSQPSFSAGVGGSAITFGPIPNIYFNGFALGLTPADISMLATLDGQPQVRLSMSFTTAKTLSSYLNQLLIQLESVTNHVIMETAEVEQGLRKIEENKSGTPQP